MRKSVMSGIAAGVVGGAMMLSGAPVSAATLPGSALAAPGQTAMVDTVQFGFGFGYGDRYGQRYGYSGYPYYGGHPYYGRYHGRYRSGPSFGFGFTVPGTTFGLTPGYGGSSAHVQWCMNRYRTYDPTTDTYIPRVGERAYCDSPYN